MKEWKVYLFCSVVQILVQISVMNIERFEKISDITRLIVCVTPKNNLC